jgi:hypothetical protein
MTFIVYPVKFHSTARWDVGIKHPPSDPNDYLFLIKIKTPDEVWVINFNDGTATFAPIYKKK